MRLEKRRVLVVGASSGIGRATGLAAAAEGARVAFAARREERVREAAGQAGGGAIALGCDVAREEDCRAVVEEVVGAFGGLDAVVYAPGIGLFKPIEEHDAADWRRVLDTNLVGASLVLGAAIPHLRAVRGKAVVLSSIAIDDRPPRPLFASYVVSKVALEALVRSWQSEHRDVAFTTVAMGDTLTEYGTHEDAAVMGPIVERWMREGYLFGRVMEAESVAEQVVNALASKETVRRIAITPSYPEEAGVTTELFERALDD